MMAAEETFKVAEEAARWLYRLQEEPSAQCQMEFMAWLKRSPQHMQEMLLMTAVSREFDGIDPERRIDVRALLNDAPDNLTPLQKTQTNVTAPLVRSHRRRWIVAVAAALAMFGIATGITLWNMMRSVTYSTVIGEQRTVKLDDGSVIYLNTASKMHVAYSDRARDIRLEEGEALFVVVRDPQRPFVVSTRGVAARAVGTQFNVSTHERGTTVAVMEGQVQITTSADKTAQLTKAGEEVKVTLSGKAVKRLTPPASEPTAWRQRRLVFRDDTLANIVDEFNRYNRTPKFRIATPAVGERVYTGTFDADDPQSLEQLLSKESELDLQRRGGEVVIEPR